MTRETVVVVQELLPCPFCGEAATIDETEGSQASGNAVVYRARCERFSCAESPWQSSRSEAVQWWNVRSPRNTRSSTPSVTRDAREILAALNTIDSDARHSAQGRHDKKLRYLGSALRSLSGEGEAG